MNCYSPGGHRLSLVEISCATNGQEKPVVVGVHTSYCQSCDLELQHSSTKLSKMLPYVVQMLNLNANHLLWARVVIAVNALEHAGSNMGCQ